MQFCVTCGNHGAGINMLAYIRNALIAAGEEAHTAPGLLNDGVNVLLDGVAGEHASQIGQLGKRSGRRLPRK